jgi:hypothetical protein
VNRNSTVRVIGFIGSVGLTVGLVGAAVTGTGAYFSDAKHGQIDATMGSIAITGYDGTGVDQLDMAFTDLLPGEAATATVRFQNTGRNAQDVWVVFPQSALGDFNHLTDTGLVNDRGSFAEIRIKSSGTEVFQSANLNDDHASCPPGTEDPTKGLPPCRELPHMVLLQSNLPKDAVSNFEFMFRPGAKTKGGAGLPVLSLPYTLVATQHGITPDNALNKVVVP